MAAAGDLNRGLLLGGALMAGWLLSLAGALVLGAAGISGWIWLPLMLLRTQLQTGLFIVGHDAMHGLLWPGRARRNDALGALALALYAGLPFAACRRQHQRHHRRTASAQDPDFPSDRRAGGLRWYGQFMARYLSPLQMLRLVGGWSALALLSAAWLGCPITAAAATVLLACTLPLLLSSLQLFVFGTYLPHRGQRLPALRPQPISLELPVWLSLLACFHFGYHREHHENPGLSWFELPAARQGASGLTVHGHLR